MRIYPRRILTESEKQFLIKSFKVLSYRELEPLMKASHMTIRSWYIELGLVKNNIKKHHTESQYFKVNKVENWLV